MNTDRVLLHRRCTTASSHQRGVVLFVALIVLIIMTLAGLGMLRQMSAGSAIAGNVAFKENTTSSADDGTEEARAWLLNTPLSLNVDQPGSGYLSTWTGGVDPTQYDWTQAATAANESATTSGSTVRFIIHRLCETTGLDPNDPAQRCSDYLQTSGASHGGGSYGNGGAPPPPIPFYRITTRVDGPRNTTSYTQVMMY